MVGQSSLCLLPRLLGAGEAAETAPPPDLVTCMNQPQNDANPGGRPAGLQEENDSAAALAAAQPATAQPTPAPLDDGSAPTGQLPSDAQRASLPKIIPFAALARCGEEIWIENEGQIYRLRKTRQGKLILTK